MKVKSLKPYKVSYRGEEFVFQVGVPVEIPDEAARKIFSNPRVSRFLVRVNG